MEGNPISPNPDDSCVNSGAPWPPQCYSRRGDAYEDLQKLTKKFHITQIPTTTDEENVANALTMTHEYYLHKLLTARASHELTKLHGEFYKIRSLVETDATAISLIDDIQQQEDQVVKGANELSCTVTTVADNFGKAAGSLKTVASALAKFDGINKDVKTANFTLNEALQVVSTKLQRLEQVVEERSAAASVDKPTLGSCTSPQNSTSSSKPESNDPEDEEHTDCTRCNTFPSSMFTPPDQLKLEDFEEDKEKGTAKKVHDTANLKPFCCPWVISSTNEVCGERLKSLQALKQHKVESHDKADFEVHAKLGKIFDPNQPKCEQHKLYKYSGGCTVGTNHCVGIETKHPSARRRHMADSLHLEDLMLSTLQCLTCKVHFPNRSSYIAHFFQNRGSVCSGTTDKSRKRSGILEDDQPVAKKPRVSAAVNKPKGEAIKSGKKTTKGTPKSLQLRKQSRSLKEPSRYKESTSSQREGPGPEKMKSKDLAKSELVIVSSEDEEMDSRDDRPGPSTGKQQQLGRRDKNKPVKHNLSDDEVYYTSPEKKRSTSSKIQRKVPAKVQTESDADSDEASNSLTDEESSSKHKPGRSTGAKAKGRRLQEQDISKALKKEPSHKNISDASSSKKKPKHSKEKSESETTSDDESESEGVSLALLKQFQKFLKKKKQKKK